MPELIDNILLGVNIDHIATLRQARGTNYPDPVQAAFIAEQAGADGITVHLREDRRHIVDRDVEILNQTIQTRMNLEMAITEEMLSIAERIKPVYSCFVPEKREEITTEGGLDVAGSLTQVKEAIARMSAAGVAVSLFIDADEKQIQAASDCGAPIIELHTGHYADATSSDKQKHFLNKIIRATEQATSLGIQVNAGHGLHYHNVKPIAAIEQIVELNIGHAIIAQAVFSGLDAAVAEMKSLMLEARF
jgi:pyridoxine 5-phosphate synthase